MFILAAQINNDMDTPYKLPKELEPFRERLLATEKPFLRLSARPAEALLLWNSKLGGQPYWPKGEPFPVNPDGVQLFFLAQINFAEAPPLAGFPDSGILQFYITDDGLYGMGEEDREAQHNFRVLYFPAPLSDPDALTTDFSFLRDYDDVPLDPARSFALHFEPGRGPMPESDYRFDALFGEDFFGRFGAEEWNVAEAYNDIADAAGHRIGGYAEFTQEDPREADDPMELLFQLDTDNKIGCRWGDMGVANFFIRPEDLQRRDFSRVLYNWDCY